MAQNSPYSGTKGLINSLIKGVAVEQASCFCPGAIDTAWTHKETGTMDSKMEEILATTSQMRRRRTPDKRSIFCVFLLLVMLVM